MRHYGVLIYGKIANNSSEIECPTQEYLSKKKHWKSIIETNPYEWL